VAWDVSAQLADMAVADPRIDLATAATQGYWEQIYGDDPLPCVSGRLAMICLASRAPVLVARPGLRVGGPVDTRQRGQTDWVIHAR
jgi:hypothetical protein